MKLKSYLPQTWYQRYFKPLEIKYVQSKGKRIYSQEGEDQLIEKLSGVKGNGFYIDIGAHHPVRFSNTYYFYLQGWSGINIEPNPDMFNYFLKQRPRDINLNLGICNKTTELMYYYFNEPALNTFSTETVHQLQAGSHQPIRTQMIPVTTLPIAIKNIKLPEVIDFMSIDTEGSEWEIISTNDWDRIRPRLLLIEIKGESVKHILDSEIARFLISKNYDLIAKLYNTAVFKIQ